MLFLLPRQEQMVSIEVKLDHRIHNRIIGQKGKNVRKIMDEYNVDIRFPRNSNEDYVTITGSENAVDDCEEHLLMLEEEYVSSQYTISPVTQEQTAAGYGLHASCNWRDGLYKTKCRL